MRAVCRFRKTIPGSRSPITTWAHRFRFRWKSCSICGKRETSAQTGGKVEYERQSAIEERRVTIATIYSKVLSYMPILKATTEKRVFADAQYAISQNDFINSKIGASEINVEKERQIKAITEYENVRSELYGLLLQLEILSNTEIISKK